MHRFIPRMIQKTIEKSLSHNPAVAILGPRQCGKSFFAKKIIQDKPDSLYLDLESPSDLRKLEEVESFFAINKGKLVCLDEIQRVPEIFAPLRSIIDRNETNG